MEALVLAGGRGTRLASVVSDRAKPVAMVAGKPFLHHVLAALERTPQVTRVILCVGHQAQSVHEAMGDRFGRLPIAYSPEESPLGTGGALAQALRRFHVEASALAINGDSFFGLHVASLLDFHRNHGALATLAAARLPEAARYGALRLSGPKVTGFREKGLQGPAWINAGWYVLGERAVAALRERLDPFSLEHEALTPWAGAGRLAAYRSRARFVDIGTPEDYALAGHLVSRR